MSAAADVECAHQDAKLLIKLEQFRRSVDADRARMDVADREGIAHGTFENIVRKRIKGVEGWLRDKLTAALIRELQAEIQRFEHELQMARLRSARPDSQQVASALALVERAKRLLAEAANRPSD